MVCCFGSRAEFCDEPCGGRNSSHSRIHKRRHFVEQSPTDGYFLGKVSRFPNGAQAVPIDQQEGSPARDEFYASYAGKSPAQMKSHWSKIIFTGRGQPPKTVSNNVEVRKLIAADSQAIGYIERSALDSTVKMVIQP
jgi:hypothetical protein